MTPSANSSLIAVLRDRFGVTHRLTIAGSSVRDVLRVNGIPPASVAVYHDGTLLTAHAPLPHDGVIIVQMLRTYHLADLLQPHVRHGLVSDAATYVRQQGLFTADGGFEMYEERLSDQALIEAIERDFADGLAGVPTLREGERCAIGLSGGRDSVALLLLVKRVADRMGLTLTAVHFTGTVPERETAFAIKLCEEEQIPIQVVSEQHIMAKCRLTVSFQELLALHRRERGPFANIAWLHVAMREAVEDVARQVGASTVLLGLMRDDLVASLLHGCIVGAPMLSPFRHRWGAIEYAYPLWSISKQDVYHYARARVPHLSGQSNATGDENGSATRDAMYLINDMMESALPSVGARLLLGAEEMSNARRSRAQFIPCAACGATLLQERASPDVYCEICAFAIRHGVTSHRSEDAASDRVPALQK